MRLSPKAFNWGGEGEVPPPPENLVNINLYIISCINCVEKVEKDAQRGQKSCPGGGNRSGLYISSPLANFSCTPLIISQNFFMSNTHKKFNELIKAWPGVSMKTIHLIRRRTLVRFSTHLSFKERGNPCRLLFLSVR